MEVLIICGIILACCFIFLLIYAQTLSKHSFMCKNCSEKFNVKRSKLIFVTHADNDFVLECPHCKKKGYCKLIDFS